MRSALVTAAFLLRHPLLLLLSLLGALRRLARRVTVATRRTIATVAASSRSPRSRRGGAVAAVVFHAFGPIEQRLHRQLDAALFVGLEHLDLDDLAFAPAQSVTFSTRWCAIWLMCSRPSLPGSRLTSAPKSRILVIGPS